MHLHVNLVVGWAVPFVCVALSLGGWFNMSISAADETNPQPPSQARPTILVFGDSIAAGFGLELDQAFPALLQQKIDALGWNYSVVNAGLSGDTTAGGLRRIDWLLKRRIDVLVLELGGNDGLRGISPDATKTNLQAIVERTLQKYPQARIVIAGMQMPPNLGDEYLARFRQLFPELAERNRAALIPFLLEGVGGRPELNQPDRIHPNVEGHKIVADNVWKVLKPVLESLTLDRKRLPR
jgi:acyl-CoA thioesterase-1